MKLRKLLENILTESTDDVITQISNITNSNIVIFDKFSNDVGTINSPKADTMYFGYSSNGDYNEYTGKSIKLPSNPKNITVDWVLNKFSSAKTFKSFAEKFEKFLRNNIGNGTNVYATTYGVGIFLAKDGSIEKVKKILTDNGIKYTTERSDAGWVYRFIISKQKSNIEKLDNLDL